MISPLLEGLFVNLSLVYELLHIACTFIKLFDPHHLRWLTQANMTSDIGFLEFICNRVSPNRRSFPFLSPRLLFWCYSRGCRIREWTLSAYFGWCISHTPVLLIFGFFGYSLRFSHFLPARTIHLQKCIDVKRFAIVLLFFLLFPISMSLPLPRLLKPLGRRIWHRPLTAPDLSPPLQLKLYGLLLLLDGLLFLLLLLNQRL